MLRMIDLSFGRPARWSRHGDLIQTSTYIDWSTTNGQIADWLYWMYRRPIESGRYAGMWRA